MNCGGGAERQTAFVRVAAVSRLLTGPTNDIRTNTNDRRHECGKTHNQTLMNKTGLTILTLSTDGTKNNKTYESG